MIYKTNTTQKSKDRGTRFLLDDAMKESTAKIKFRGFDFILVHFCMYILQFFVYCLHYISGCRDLKYAF